MVKGVLTKLRMAPLAGTLIIVTVFAVSGFLYPSIAVATVTVNAATGGSAISADTTGGSYTALTGPIVSETVVGDVGTGTIILNAPAGFQFRTTSNSVTATRTNINNSTCSGSGNKALKINNGTSQTVTPSVSSISITITQSSTGNSSLCSGIITWSGIAVRPTSGSPLASGNVTDSGTSVIAGVTSATNFGTLAEVAGTVTKLAFTTQPGSTTHGSALNPQPVVKTQDQFGNNSTNGLASSKTVTLAVSTGTGSLQGTASLDIGTGSGNGTDTFSGLKISTAGAGKQLTASATGLTSTVSNSFTISQMALTITAAANSKTYDSGTTATSTPSITSGSLQGTDTANFVETYGNKNVGTGKTLTPSGTVTDGNSGNNYTYTFVANTTGVITAKTLTISGVTANNKTYDGTQTITLNTGSAALSGVVAGDAVTLNSSGATGSSADKNVGTGKAVTVSGFSISGTNAGNYSLTQPGLSTNITIKNLTVSGVTANNKTYNGNTVAALTLGTAALVGAASGDTIQLNTGNAAGAFATKNAGTGKTVGVTGLSLNGTDASNYSLTAPTATADITKKTLTVTMTGQNKIFDGTTAATVVFSSDKIEGDDVVITGTAAFADSNVATGIIISGSGIALSGGADASNYTLGNTTASAVADITPNSATVTLNHDNLTRAYTGASQSVSVTSTNPTGLSYAVTYDGSPTPPTSAGSYAVVASITDQNYAGSDSATLVITPVTLSLSGVNISDKIYDATTTATVDTSAAHLNGIIGSDNVSLAAGATAVFSDKNVGAGKTVSISNLSLTGTAAGNYTLTTPTATASITRAPLTVSGVVAASKVYDGTATTTLNATNAVLTPMGNDSLTLDISSTTATFSDKNAADNKSVVIAGLALGGVDVGNYALTQPTATTSITKRPITVTAATDTKTYDGTLTATSTPTITAGSLVTGDTAAWTETFSDKSVGTGKTLTPTGSLSDGNNGNNYTITFVNNTSGVITAKTLTVTATGINKIYDGTTVATTTLSTDKISGDDVTASSTASVFIDALVGNDKTVTASGIALGGTDALNYAASATATTTAAISARSIAVTADNKSKTYGGADPTLTYQITSGSLASGDSIAGSLARATGESVGTYAISQGTLTAGSNYNTNFTGADFTIAIGSTNSVVALATSTSEGGFQATVPTATTASTTSSGIITTLAIPTGTVITGPSTWNGKLTLPTVTTTYTLTANSGNTAAAVEAIEVGAGDIPLTLDQAVKLTFAAQVGKLIGWSQAGVFHQIIAVCDSTTTPTLASGSDCRVDVGSDLVVWTKHFSTFIAYTETAVPPSTPFGGGGGNGSPFLAYGGGSGGSGITTFPPSASGGNSQSAPTESGAAVVIPFASARPPGVSAAGPLTPETAAPPTAQGVESPPTPEATQPALNTQVAAVAAADFQGYAWLWVLGIGGLAIIGLWIYSRKSNTKL